MLDRVFSSPEPKAHKVSLKDGRRAGVRALTLSNMNISATSRLIATKFYLKHHRGGKKAALGFWPDRIVGFGKNTGTPVYRGISLAWYVPGHPFPYHGILVFLFLVTENLKSPKY